VTIAEFSRKIELHFWDLAIPAMSASPLIQKGIKLFYRINRKTNPMRWMLIGASTAVFGYINGLLVFWMFAR
jgi:hypothetical protein